MKVAILNISIGSYSIFWKDFFISAEENFLPEYEKHYFVFTDKEYLYGIESDKVSIIFQKDLGWPFNTMKRFEMFEKCEEELKKYDYIFFINGNAIFKKKLTRNFINENKNIITIVHPGLANYPIDKYPYERRKKSMAYISKKEGKYYVQGAFIGGKRESFIKMTKFLNERIKKDIANGIIAIWHDESFLNFYILNRNDIQIMGKQYLYYEEYVFPWEPVILLRDKTKYLEKNNARFKGRVNFKNKIFLKLRNLKLRFLIAMFPKLKLKNVDKDDYIDKDLI